MSLSGLTGGSDTEAVLSPRFSLQFHIGIPSPGPVCSPHLLQFAGLVHAGSCWWCVRPSGPHLLVDVLRYTCLVKALVTGIL